jgi:hypothetical protein
MNKRDKPPSMPLRDLAGIAAQTADVAAQVAQEAQTTTSLISLLLESLILTLSRDGTLSPQSLTHLFNSAALTIDQLPAGDERSIDMKRRMRPMIVETGKHFGVIVPPEGKIPAIQPN